MRLVLFLILLGIPVLEIWTLIQVGQAIGGWPTAALLLAAALLGVWIIRGEGRKALRNLQEALRSGRMPEHDLADGAVAVAGGMLLIVPGFVTDLLGLLCVLPLTRPLVRGLGAALFARRIRGLAEAGPGVGSPFGEAGPPFDLFDAARGRGSGPVIHGEVIRDEPGGPAVRDSGRGITDR
ncbi:FxsA family protein [Streptosporangium sp. NPDC006007]|uniref:FxsA family protein n=1 Tax=Streptosporangium sp. NPDC006007 TaxID=3154575 RepID=UPI0033AEDB0E